MTFLCLTCLSLSTWVQTLLEDAFHFQAYEGLQTARRLREQYLFLPAKVSGLLWFHTCWVNKDLC